MILKFINKKFKYNQFYTNLHKIRHFALNTSEISNETRNKNIELLYEKHKSQIYFSSVLQDEVELLSYKKRVIIENIYAKLEKQKNEIDSKVKPFPISLNYMKDIGETNLKLEQDDTCGELQKIYSEMKQNLENISIIQHKIGKKSGNERPAQHTWMQDYEYFEEKEGDFYSEYGTPDLSIPISKIPCGGCGAVLHCADTSLPGYIPSEIYKNRTSDELKTIICQRCHFLKNYNTAINVRVNPEDYVNIVSSIKDKIGLVVLIVDLLDFPCSIWPEIVDVLGTKRPIFLVGNKVDLLPKDSKNYLEHVKKCLFKSATEHGLSKSNIVHVCLISATTGYGVEQLITQLHNKWGPRGDVYLVGCSNVGKSSLFNTLLGSDYCKVQASNLIQRATASPWPGTTLRLLKFPILRPSDMRLYVRTQRLISERVQTHQEDKLRKTQANQTGNKKFATLIGHIGKTFVPPPEDVSDPFSYRGEATGKIPLLTLNENDKEYVKSKWCYDTPGVMQLDQVLNILTTDELIRVIPKEMILPRTFMLKPNMSLLLAGLGRFDFLNGNCSIRIVVFSSQSLPITICNTEFASQIYNDFLGTEVLGVPIDSGDRLNSWPGLESSNEIIISGEESNMLACDIVLASAGWLGLNIRKGESITIKIWTPHKRGVYVREPALVQHAIKLKGKKIRHSLTYTKGKSFIKT